ncbi:MAG: IclR family transcriptional regulator [Peptostreptococcaceae bacterium]|nr:IclR family transcriptional regulator [Peptostreptococcaceae bacterium]
MDNIKNANNVKSIIKAFAIIEALDESGPLSIGELSKTLIMDKATVHRLINTIKDIGHVTQNPETKKYSNSIKLFEIGQNVIAKTGLFEAARPYIELLSSATGESINLGIVRDNKIVYVDKKEGKSPIKVSIKIGTSIPMYCTGMGKAVLSHMNETERESVINRIVYERYTRKTSPDKETLLRRLDKCRRLGYSIDNEEYVDGLISFGAPIFNYKGEPIAAISISFPKPRYDEADHGVSYPELIKDAAANISKQMGYIK